jgi:hypothetical protein
MAISLASIKRNAQKPPKIVIYGVPGIGKTKWASSAPAPIFICAEDGLGLIDVPHFPRANSFSDVQGAIAALYNDQHEFGTVVIDTIDALEPLIWAHVVATVPHEKGRPVSSIEDYGFGKGYVHAQRYWLELLRGLDGLRDERGMAVILCAHSKVANVKAPDSDDYDKFTLKVHDKAESVIRGWTDCLLFANYEQNIISAGRDGDRKRATGTGKRLLFTEERPAFAAKNRYSLPPVLPLDWNAFVSAQIASSTSATASAPSSVPPAVA